MRTSAQNQKHKPYPTMRYVLIILGVLLLGVAIYVIWKKRSESGGNNGAGNNGGGGASQYTPPATPPAVVTPPPPPSGGPPADPNVRAAWQNVINDLASKQVPLNRGGLTANRTKMMEWAKEQPSYASFESALNSSKYSDGDKQVIIEAMRQTLWNGVFMDYKADRAKRVSDAVKVAVAVAKQAAALAA